MKNEVLAASDFIVNLVRISNACSLSEETLVLFRNTLAVVMRNHYQNHWFPERPFKGSGYRCIRINGQMDPLVAVAGISCGLDLGYLRSLFPGELTLWVDPHEVSYRIGEDGSVCVLLEEPVVRPRPAPVAAVEVTSSRVGSVVSGAPAWSPAADWGVGAAACALS